TLATEPDITSLTSGSDPVPGLYQMTVAEALASGRPTVVTLATPAFCQTDICAPVVDSVEAVYEDYKDQANFLHLEIYKDFQE
ncbi:MAG: thioredoxin family protein, partial [Phycisphaerae bacterium]|nr:thioredoxin family protein [Phycisphaerae bacterium]NIP54729.1 thioredoxin family protein [Phycisphaerae bacterium]NIW47185.1 thioredoxin family protein [Gammaproteobacteria bacterium]NIX30769.1 thioredoxin family protein [Phycisphaerae bacterium]